MMSTGVVFQWAVVVGFGMAVGVGLFMMLVKMTDWLFSLVF